MDAHTNTEQRAGAGCDTKRYGFTFTPMMDSIGNDYKNMTSSPLDEVATACRYDRRCDGFNTNGFLKDKLQPISSLNRWTDNPCQGLYSAGNALVLGMLC